MSETPTTDKEIPAPVPTPQGPVGSQVFNPIKKSQYLSDMLTLPEDK